MSYWRAMLNKIFGVLAVAVFSFEVTDLKLFDQILVWKETSKIFPSKVSHGSHGSDQHQHLNHTIINLIENVIWINLGIEMVKDILVWLI